MGSAPPASREIVNQAHVAIVGQLGQGGIGYTEVQLETAPQHSWSDPRWH